MTLADLRASLFLGRTARSMSARYGRRGLLVDALLLATLVLLAIGVSTPFLTIHRLFLFAEAHSLIEVALSLLQDDEFLLAGVVLVFSVLIPALKLLLLHHAWSVAAVDDNPLARHLRLLEFIGKWSMLEVFVGALVVFAIKASWLGEATTGPGLYCFAGAAILTTLLAHAIGRAFAGGQHPPSAA